MAGVVFAKTTGLVAWNHTGHHNDPHGPSTGFRLEFLRTFHRINIRAILQTVRVWKTVLTLKRRALLLVCLLVPALVTKLVPKRIRWVKRQTKIVASQNRLRGERAKGKVAKQVIAKLEGSLRGIIATTRTRIGITKETMITSREIEI